MTVRDILLLGDPRLYERSTDVEEHELPTLANSLRDLHDTMRDFQARHGWGRAIAAPQIGVARRIVAMHVDRPLTFFNPVIDEPSEACTEHWEDCMSFPDLLVRLRNPSSCRLTYRDEAWNVRRVYLSEDYAELLQHEIDHLDGVLAVQRAIDEHSFALRSTRPEKDLTMRGEFRPLDAP